MSTEEIPYYSEVPGEEDISSRLAAIESRLDIMIEMIDSDTSKPPETDWQSMVFFLGILATLALFGGGTEYLKYLKKLHGLAD
ncbi:hypothetical protein CJU89_5965 [Yarrowia sp. B02]|nr:hypothetical protein CJU89_5965 [Yarrowia sp. B02]